MTEEEEEEAAATPTPAITMIITNANGTILEETTTQSSIMSTTSTATTSTRNIPPTEEEEEAAAATPIPALQPSKSLPATLSSLVTPNNQHASSNNFPFPPSGENTLSERIRLITKVLTKYEDEKEELKVEKKQLDYQIVDLNEEMVEKNEEYKENEKEMGEEIDELKQEVTMLKKDLAAANVATEKNIDALEVAENKYTKLEQETTAYTVTAAVQLTTMLDNTKQLEGTIVSLKQESVTMKTEYDGNIRDLTVWNEKLEQEIVQEKSMSEQNCATHVQEASKWKAILRFAEQDVSDAKQDRDTAVTTLRTENGNLQGQISVGQNTVVTLEDNLVTLGDTNTNMRAENEQLTLEKEQLQVEHKLMEESYNMTLTSHEKELALKNETIKNVCAEKVQLASEKEQLQVDLKSKEESHNMALTFNKKELASKDVELTTKNEELAQLHAEVEQLAKDVKEKLVEVKQEQLEKSNKELSERAKKDVCEYTLPTLMADSDGDDDDNDDDDNDDDKFEALRSEDTENDTELEYEKKGNLTSIDILISEDYDDLTKNVVNPTNSSLNDMLSLASLSCIW